MLPAAARRLFAHYASSDLETADARAFVALRLAEEGDRKDLRWLVASLGEAELRRVLDHHGDRQLSRRGLAFWRRVLDLPAPAGDATSEEIWPR